METETNLTQKLCSRFSQLNQAHGWNLSPKEVEERLLKVAVRLRKKVGEKKAADPDQSEVDEAILGFRRDEEVLAILSRKDDPRRGELILAYEKKWEGYLEREFPKIDAADRIEIVAKMLANLLNPSWIERYRLEGSIEAFFYQSLRYLCLDRIRGNKVKDFENIEDHPNLEGGKNPEDVVRHKRLLELLDRLLDRIAATAQDPAKFKEFILRILVEGEAPREVARAEGLSENAVRVLKAKCLTRLRLEPDLQEWRDEERRMTLTVELSDESQLLSDTALHVSLKQQSPQKRSFRGGILSCREKRTEFRDLAPGEYLLELFLKPGDLSAEAPVRLTYPESPWEERTAQTTVDLAGISYAVRLNWVSTD